MNALKKKQKRVKEYGKINMVEKTKNTETLVAVRIKRLIIFLLL